MDKDSHDGDRERLGGYDIAAKTRLGVAFTEEIGLKERGSMSHFKYKEQYFWLAGGSSTGVF